MECFSCVVVLWMSFLGLVLSGVPSVQSASGSDPGIMKITETLCGTKHPEQLATDFYQCYYELNDNEKCVFDSCQKTVFGCTLSSKKHIESACAAAEKLPMYVTCLKNNFKSCNQNFDSALRTVNICQGRVLGL